MVANQGLDYNVDIVMCIDATGSMRSIIDEVKENAVTFYKKFAAEMDEKGKTVQQLRIKVIAFRDYGFNDQIPMIESRFFNLSAGADDESAEFEAFVGGIKARGGGGDGPENALEALALAINSDWVHTGSIRRHVILLYTDTAALKLEDRRECPGYPKDEMPADLGELREWWEGQYMEKRAKRLQIFAPMKYPWKDMYAWTNTIITPSQAGKGCSDVDIATCIHLLVNSI